MVLQKNDFIELDFTGKANGELFDTTKKEEAKKLNEDIKEEEIKPLIVCIGQGMLPSGFDKALEGKEIGKEYNIKLSQDEAFGKRRKELIRTMPIKIFHEKNVNPQTGMVFSLDNILVKIISVSGGRVMADFNNPLAGKEIEYSFKILRKIEKIEEKVSSLIEFFFKMPLKYKIEGKKLIFEDVKIKPLVDLFKSKFKELLDLDIEFEDKQKDKLEGKLEEKREKEHI